MFEIQLGPAGEVVVAGRLDATRCAGFDRILDMTRAAG
jgi:hypothetical protein